MHWLVLIMGSYRTNVAFTAPATVSTPHLVIGNVSFAVNDTGILYIKWNNGTGMFRYIHDSVTTGGTAGTVVGTSTAGINPTTWVTLTGQPAMVANAAAKWMYIVNDVTGESYQVFIGCKNFATKLYYIRVHYYQ